MLTFFHSTGTLGRKVLRLLDSELSDLANARLLNAKDCLLQANALLNVEQYKGVANRAYYAVFHAMRAALALEGFDSKKHSGIIAKFREAYIKTNLFNVEIFEIISTLFRVRSASDYDDFYILSKEEAIKQLESAKMMVVEIESFILGSNLNHPGA